MSFPLAYNSHKYKILERAELDRSPLKIRCFFFYLRKRFASWESFFWVFQRDRQQDKAIISISLVWAVTKDTVPLKTTLPMTFHCLILCSNLGNCLNHRELIPVMPLPPPLLCCIGPMHRTTGPDSPWIPAKPNDFQVPRPLLVSVCLHSRNGPVFCLQTLFSCQIVAISVLFYFHTHRWCQNAKALFASQWSAPICCSWDFFQRLQCKTVFQSSFLPGNKK